MKWHRRNLKKAGKSFICRQEGETEHFTTKKIAYHYMGSAWSTPEKSTAE